MITKTLKGAPPEGRRFWAVVGLTAAGKRMPLLYPACFPEGAVRYALSRQDVESVEVVVELTAEEWDQAKRFLPTNPHSRNTVSARVAA